MVKSFIFIFLGHFLLLQGNLHGDEVMDPLKEFKKAILEGSKAKFKKLLEDVVNINAADPDGELIHSAIFFNKNWAVEELIKANYDFDRPGFMDKTPLMEAVSRRGNLPLVKTLVEAGANVNYIHPGFGGDVLTEAISSGDMKIVNYLLQKGAKNLPAQCLNGQSALGRAIGGDNLIMVKRLLEDSTLALRSYDNFHQSPLMQAVKRGNWKTYQLLLSKGAQIDTEDSQQNGLLHAAISSPRRNKKIIADLLQKGLDPKARNILSQTPLELAMETDDPEIVKMLIDYGADPNQMSGTLAENRKRLLARAFLSGKFKAAHELLKHVGEAALADGLKGAILSDLPTDQFLGYLQKLPAHPLRDGKIFALGGQKADLKIMQKLLDRGARINELEDGQSAVMRASASGGLAGLKWLDQKGADLNLINEKKSTALHMASSSGQAETLQYLLDKNVIVDRRDDKGETALFAAARGNFGPGIEKLLAKGASAGIKNNDNFGPLMVAVQEENLDAARLLVSRSPLNAQDIYGRSALQMAIFQDNSALVRILIDECAPETQKDRSGKTAYDYLFFSQQKEEIRAILDSRKDIEKCRNI